MRYRNPFSRRPGNVSHALPPRGLFQILGEVLVLVVDAETTFLAIISEACVLEEGFVAAAEVEVHGAGLEALNGRGIHVS